MSDFKLFRNKVQKNIENMNSHGMFFTVDVNKDELWKTYLSSFEPGTNNMYIERTEHDCNCCKNFIRDIGNLVVLTQDGYKTIWDDIEEGIYTPVAKALSVLVKSKQIENKFITESKHLGNDFTIQHIAPDTTLRWTHFQADVPISCVMKQSEIATTKNDIKTNKELLDSSLRMISLESVEIVLEFIAQNSVYRLEEQKHLVSDFKKSMFAYSESPDKEMFLWEDSLTGSVATCRIKNTVVGTLLIDITNGVDLEDAVKKYESKVAPANYKRPTALVSKRMIANAQQKFAELGLTGAEERRYAVTDDITINNVIYADKSVKVALNAFDALSDNIPEKPKKYDNVETVTIEKFIADIMPTASKIELLFENKHTSNLVSLIAPINKESEYLFQWNNNFSLSYNGEVADSMKEQVKAAGGKVDAELRFSIMWNDGDIHNANDLDAHCIQPGANPKIYYSAKGPHYSSGELDIDIMDPTKNKAAIENIRWSNRDRMPKGDYLMRVHNYAQRGGNDGFRAQIEFDGVIHDFDYRQAIHNKMFIDVANVNFDGTNFTIEPLLESSQSVNMTWGINSQSFHKVDMIMNSPNYWNGDGTGNKHWLFMLEDCINPDETRGFYNEFLRQELREHRKVFEILGSTMKVKKSSDQLSGIGFSSTQKNSVTCKITGSMTRIIEIKF